MRARNSRVRALVVLLFSLLTLAVPTSALATTPPPASPDPAASSVPADVPADGATPGTTEPGATPSGSVAPSDGTSPTDVETLNPGEQIGQTEAKKKAPIVLIVTEAIRWRDVDAKSYPNVVAWAATGTMMNVVPQQRRSWTCPVDGWLAMSSGVPVTPRSIEEFPTCAEWDVAAGQQLRAFDPTFHKTQRAGVYAVLGKFGQELETEGIKVAPIGVSGAVITANAGGVVPANWIPAPSANSELAAAVAAATEENQLIVVDASDITLSQDPDRQAETMKKLAQAEPTNTDPAVNDAPDPDPLPQQINTFRQDQVESNLARLDAILAKLPSGTHAIVVSVQDVDMAASLQLGFDSYGPDQEGTPQRGLGWTPEVRQVGNVQLLSFLPTIADTLRIDFEGPKYQTTSRPSASTTPSASFASYVGDLADSADRATAIRGVRNQFIRSLSFAAIGFFLVSIVALSAPVGRRLFRYRAVGILWNLAGLTVSAVPVASHILTMTYAWWRSSNTEVSLIGGSWLLAFGIAIAARALLGHWKLGPFTLIMALTGGLILADVATGSRALADAPIGFNTLVGARFYGLGNEAFALEATGTLLTLAVLATVLVRFGLSRGVSAGIIGALGLAAAAIGVMPSMGADFGGVLAILPALAVLVLVVGGYELTLRRVLLVGGGAIGVAGAVAIADWMRPASVRTHLGAFVQSVLDGDAQSIIFRKIAVNIRLLQGSTHRLVVLAALLLFFIALIHVLFLKRASEDGKLGPVKKYWVQGWGWLTPSSEKVRVAVAETGPAPEDETPVPDDGAGTSAPAPDTIVASEPGINLTQEALRRGMAAVGICMAIAFAVNDSGIVLPGMSAILALPALSGLVAEHAGRQARAGK